MGDLQKHDVDVCAVIDTKRELTEGQIHEDYYVEGTATDPAHNGVAFAIKHQLRRDCEFEALSTRLATLTLRLHDHGAGKRSLCFVAGYAPIRPSIAEAKAFWDSTRAAIKRVKSDGHCVILLGDLNAKVKMSDIRGEDHSCAIPTTMDTKFPPKTDRNGRYMLQTCKLGKLCIVNFMHHMKRKKYNTFIAPPNSAARDSITDYVAISSRSWAMITDFSTHKPATGTDHKGLKFNIRTTFVAHKGLKKKKPPDRAT